MSVLFIIRYFNKEGFTATFVLKPTCHLSYNIKVIDGKERVALQAIQIQLTSVIRSFEGETDKYEMWLEGQLTEKRDAHYIRYTEEQEAGTITTIIKITEDAALIMRSGAVKMRLPLHKKDPQTGHYTSAAGEMPLDIITKQLEHDTANGEFSTQYELAISGQTVGLYTLKITYTEVQ